MDSASGLCPMRQNTAMPNPIPCLIWPMRLGDSAFPRWKRSGLATSRKLKVCGRCGSRKGALVGYWEMAGHLTDEAGPLYPNGFPPDMIAVIEQAFGRKVIGNRRASGTVMLRECEAEHLSSGALIVWTDGRRTCHVAVHENAMRRDELFQRCRDVRKLLKDPWGIWRVSVRA